MVGVWVAVVATEIMIALTTVTLLWPGLLEKILGKPFSIVDYWGTSRVFFETVTLGSLAAIVVMAIVFWLVGRRNLATGAVGENALLAIAAEVIGAGAVPAAATIAPAPDEA